jgi:hypothetical protein
MVSKYAWYRLFTRDHEDGFKLPELQEFGGGTAGVESGMIETKRYN